MRQIYDDMRERIEEIVDPPSRNSTVFRDLTQDQDSDLERVRNQIKRIIEKPGSNTSIHELQKVINILDDQIYKWESEEETYGPTEARQNKIKTFRYRRDNYLEKMERAKAEYYKRKEAQDDSRRREEPRRRANYTDMDITDRYNATRLNHLSSYQRSYSHQNQIDNSDDDDIENMIPRSRRDRSWSPPSHYKRKVAQDDSRTREEPRRRANYTDMDITDRGNSTRLNHLSSYQRSYSHRNQIDNSDDDDIENMTRKYNTIFKSPPSHGYHQSTMNQQRRDESYAHERSHYSKSAPSNSHQVRMSSYQRSYSHRNQSDNSDDDDIENMIPRSRCDRSRSPPSHGFHQSTMNQQRRDKSYAHQRSHYSMRAPSGSHQERMRSSKSRRVTKKNYRKWRPGQKALYEIQKYQKSTDLLIPKAPFARIVHEMIHKATSTSHDLRVRANTFLPLQEAAEAFLVQMFHGSMKYCNSAKRVTLMQTDIQNYRSP